MTGKFTIVVHRHGRDDGLVRAFVGRQGIGVLGVQHKRCGPVLEAHARAGDHQAAARAQKEAVDEAAGIALPVDDDDAV